MSGKNRMSGANGAPQQPQPGDAFRKPTAAPEFDPTRPRKFNLGAFVSGAQEHINTRTIPVTSLPNVAAEAERLTAERDKLDRRTRAEGTDDDQDDDTGRRRRMAETSPTATRRTEIDARLAELYAQLDGTWVHVKIRPLDPAEQDEVRRKRIPAGVELVAALFEAAATISETGDDDGDWEQMSTEEWFEFLNAIGQGQYATLDQAFTSVTYQAVTPDFYERYSASRTTESTSSS